MARIAQSETAQIVQFLLVLPALEDQGCVGAAKSEAVAHDMSDLFLDRLVRRVVEIAGRIGVFEVDRRRDDALAERLDADDQFDAAAFRRHFGTSGPMWESPEGGGMVWAATAPFHAARALREGAIAVMDRHDGSLPDDPDALRAAGARVVAAVLGSDAGAPIPTPNVSRPGANLARSTSWRATGSCGSLDCAGRETPPFGRATRPSTDRRPVL